MNDPFRELPEQLERCAFCHDQCMSATPELVATGSQAHVVSRAAIRARLLDRGDVAWSAAAAAPLFYGLNDGWQREYCIFMDEGQRIEPYLRRMRSQALSRGMAPAPVAAALARARASGNVYGIGLPEVAPHGSGAERVVYIHDAATRALTPAVVGTAVRVLEAAGAQVADLAVGSGGMVELDLGDVELAREAANAVASAISDNGATTLVTTDPTLAYVIRYGYPYLGIVVKARVLHIAEFLAARDIACRAGPRCDVVFHDPPWLSRGLGVVDAVREILRRVPGVRLLEPATSGRLVASDGPLAGYPDPAVARQIARERFVELSATGAELVVTASPYSQANLRACSRGIPVIDLSEFLAARLPGGRSRARRN